MMTNKQTHFLIASFALLIFVIIGYTVKFFPERLALLDNTIQAEIRGNLPIVLTQFFRGVTVFGNVMTQVLLVIVSVLVLFFMKWKIEALFILSNGAIAAFLITTLKLFTKDQDLLLSIWFMLVAIRFPVAMRWVAC